MLRIDKAFRVATFVSKCNEFGANEVRFVKVFFDEEEKTWKVLTNIAFNRTLYGLFEISREELILTYICQKCEFWRRIDKHSWFGLCTRNGGEIRYYSDTCMDFEPRNGAKIKKTKATWRWILEETRINNLVRKMFKGDGNG